MKFFRLTLWCFWLTAGWQPVRALDNLSLAMPEDALVYGTVKNLTTVVELSEQPMAKAIWTPAAQRAFAPLVKTVEELLEGGKGADTKVPNFAEFRKLFPGRVAMSVTVGEDGVKRMADRRARGKESPAPDSFQIMFAANYTGDVQQIDKWMETVPRGSQTRGLGKEIDGLKVFREGGGDSVVHWTVVDGVFVLALATADQSATSLAAAVARIRKGARSLDDAPRFKPVAARLQNATLAFFADLQPLFREVLAVKAAENGNLTRPVKLLGIDKIGSLYALLDLQQESLDFEQGFTFESKPPLMHLLATKGAGTAPTFLPKEASDGFYGTFEPAKLLDAWESIFFEIPAAKEAYVTIFDQLKAKTGVDLKLDLFAALGPEYWFCTAREGARLSQLKETAPEAGLDRTFVLGLQVRERLAVQRVLGKLLPFTGIEPGALTVREFQGFSVTEFQQQQIAYVLTDDWLIVSVGPSAFLDNLLTRMKTPVADHFFARPPVVSGLRRLPEGGVLTFHSDLNAVVNGVRRFLALAPAGSVEQFLNPESLDGEVESPSSLTGRIYDEPQAFRLRAHFDLKTK